AGRPPEEIARRGIGLVPQGRRIFPTLTVLENLTIARRGTSGWTLERVFATFPKLLALRDARGATLSGGELQLLAIARALMGNVDLLLLDEPFEGLAPAIVEVVWTVLRELRGTTTVLLVEQNADLALALSDRAYVMRNGSIVWEGAARTLHADAELRLKLLGVQDRGAERPRRTRRTRDATRARGNGGRPARGLRPGPERNGLEEAGRDVPSGHGGRDGVRPPDVRDRLRARSGAGRAARCRASRPQ